jgi:hypothetical protein
MTPPTGVRPDWSWGCTGKDRWCTCGIAGRGHACELWRGPEPDRDYRNLATYRRPSDGRPRIAGGDHEGRLCIWDGDDLSLLNAVSTNVDGCCVQRLLVYEEPVTGKIRLVAA